jgi:hypothetical protein
MFISLPAALILAAVAFAEPPAFNEAQLDQKWNSLPAREKAAALRLHQALRQMPPDERKFVQDRIGRFMEMPAEDRRRLKENNDRWKKMTPEEQQQAREQFRQRRKEFEEQWKKEHPGESAPPFPFHGHHKRNLAAPAQGAEPKTTQPNPTQESTQ